MLLSAVSVLVLAQSSSEIPEGIMNNPVFLQHFPAGYEFDNTVVFQFRPLNSQTLTNSYLHFLVDVTSFDKPRNVIQRLKVLFSFALSACQP